MEDKQVNISRSMVSVTYPARIMLVEAMNPCPCGFFLILATNAAASRTK